MKKLYNIIEVSKKSNDEFFFKIEILKGSVWFSGHFPDNPILPGVALLTTIKTLVRSFEKDECFKSYNRVKFKKIVYPEDVIDISIVRNVTNKINYRYEAVIGDELFSTGSLTFEDNQV